MFRPFDRRDRDGRTRRRLLATAIVPILVGTGALAWTGWQADQVNGVVAQLRADAARLEKQVRSSDLTAAAASMTQLRLDADRARSLTSGPLWGAAQVLPGVGRNVRAVRTVTAGAAAVLDAAQPLESVLPRLDPTTQKAAGGRIDVEALATVARTLPAVARAVDAAATQVNLLDPVPLQPQVADGVRSLQALLTGLRGPLDATASGLGIVPEMLGANGPRTYVVLLEQDAEARGTGGLVGSFALVRANQGQFALLGTQPRGALQTRTPIPAAAVPASLQELWGSDLGEWAGLNLSPHFPWTGQLVAAGWAAQHRTPKIDYVVGVDEYVVGALLTGTGPVRAGATTLTGQTAPTFLSRTIYARYPDPAAVDRVTEALVQQVFGRIATGRFSLAPIVQAMIEPVRQRRLTVWAADPAVESRLESLSIGGAIPDTAGPFAMAVVNNGGGNKLDAYLQVHTRYDPGTCEQNVRLGHITVTLTNNAPTRGLPDYVTPRSDLLLQHRPNPVVGSNRIILDVYGPVGATSPLTNLDGAAAPVTTGTDRNHPVWRVFVPIDPGQTRTVDVLVLDPVTTGVAAPTPAPVVLTQPMAIPATASTVAKVSSCGTG